jgi:hypothetical protein
MSPTCDECGQSIPSWEGNIMVQSREFFAGEKRRVSEIIIMCKPCTLRLDESGMGQRWHNMWELAWMKDNTIYYLGSIIADLIESDSLTVWKEPAVNSLFKLAAMAHPELSNSATELP